LLLALPLYLRRKPKPAPPPPPDQAELGFAPVVPTPPPPPGEERGITLGAPQRITCSASVSARGQSGTACDALPFFEEALRKAIVESADCAPRTGESGSLNYVLKVDFNQKTLHVFPGASGTLRGPQARNAARCVKQALPAPDWEQLQHRFRYYELAVLATYRTPPPTLTPSFE
jgi:hypothetical protein